MKEVQGETRANTAGFEIANNTVAFAFENAARRFWDQKLRLLIATKFWYPVAKLRLDFFVNFERNRLAASYVLYDRTEHSKGFFVCSETHPPFVWMMA